MVNDTSGQSATEIRSSCTSLGTSTSTGPGRPEPARCSASATVAASSPASCTANTALTAGRAMAQMSTS